MTKQLDYSPKSLRRVDKLIDDLWGNDGVREENLGPMVEAFVAYVPRVLERNNKGKWIISNGDVFGYEFYTDGKGTGFVVYPFEWARKRLCEEESLADKYRVVTRIGKNLS